VQPDQQGIQDRVVARAGHDLVDLGQPLPAHGLAHRDRPTGLVHPGSGVVGDQAVGDRVPVQAPHRGDEVLASQLAAAAVAPDHPLRTQQAAQLLDL
jgi:hypothetical protein